SCRHVLQAQVDKPLETFRRRATRRLCVAVGQKRRALRSGFRRLAQRFGQITSRGKLDEASMQEPLRSLRSDPIGGYRQLLSERQCRELASRPALLAVL